MRRVLPIGQVAELMARALASGKAIRKNLSTVEWNVAGSCIDPQMVNLIGRDVAPVQHRALFLDIETRCRRCEPCLKARGGLWAHRAIREVEGASRTWFCTLTVKPEKRFEYLSIARKEYADRYHDDFDSLSESRRFLALHRVMARDFTKFLKRVRKGRREHGEETVSFRYLCVAEAHKDGFPHLHALIFEKRGQPIRWERLNREWFIHGIGFGEFKLIGEGEGERRAWYVCKYLAKSMLARVRASHGFGKHDLDHSLAEALEGLKALRLQSPPAGVGGNVLAKASTK